MLPNKHRDGRKNLRMASRPIPNRRDLQKRPRWSGGVPILPLHASFFGYINSPARSAWLSLRDGIRSSNNEV